MECMHIERRLAADSVEPYDTRPWTRLPWVGDEKEGHAALSGEAPADLVRSVRLENEWVSRVGRAGGPVASATTYFIFYTLGYTSTHYLFTS